MEGLDREDREDLLNQIKTLENSLLRSSNRRQERDRQRLINVFTENVNAYTQRVPPTVNPKILVPEKRHLLRALYAEVTSTDDNRNTERMVALARQYEVEVRKTEPKADVRKTIWQPEANNDNSEEMLVLAEKAATAAEKEARDAQRERERKAAQWKVFEWMD